MRWEQGRAAVDGMLARGELERVPPSRSQADLLLRQAGLHLRSAEAVVDFDCGPPARAPRTPAQLANQGLGRRGGHIAVVDAIRAQLDPPLGGVLRPVDRMRRRRNETEYPRQDQPAVTAEEVRRDLAKVREVLDVADACLIRWARSSR